MAFQISAHGSREGVLKHISEAKAKPEGSDQRQIDAVKALLISEINALPPEINGVRVEASGQSDASIRTASFQVFPLKLHL